MATSPEEDIKSESAKSFSFLDRAGEFISGVLKGVTTDAIGAPVDITNEIVGAVTGGRLKSQEPIGGSKYLRRHLVGASGVEDKSVAETLGTLVNPESAFKAMIVGAAKFPARYKNYAEKLIQSKSNELPLTKAELFDTTGVYFDKDKKHKTIIADDKAQLNTRKLALLPDEVGKLDFAVAANTKLEDILVHPELYTLYPELKSIKISGDAKPRSGSMEIDLSKMNVGRNTQEGFLEVVLHETQHAIQMIEGFTGGGNTRQFLDFDPVSIQVKLNKARESGDVAQIAAADRFAKKANQALQEARNRYLNLPGEQEARYTQETKNLSIEALSTDVRALLQKGDTPQTYDTRPIREITK